MSKTSYALIGLMVAALLYMGAARLYEKWEHYAQQQAVAAQTDGEPFSFQRVPVSLAAPQAQEVQPPVPYHRILPEIYMEDTPLDEQTAQQQAQETLFSIVQDFRQDPSVQAFNQDLQAASNGQLTSIADLSSQNLAQFVQQNPEVLRVVQKHMNKQEFAAKINEIFSNPQFQQSVRQLQGPGQTQAAQAQ